MAETDHGDPPAPWPPPLVAGRAAPVHIADVAAQAGVSIATVSRAITRPDRVNRATRERVLEVVDRLGYTPNRAGRNLRAARSMMVLVVVPTVITPFFSELLLGVDRDSEELAALFDERDGLRWLTAADSDARRHPDREREPSRFVNDLGSDRIKGNHEHAKWVALTGGVDGKPVTIAVLCHADNFRAPQAARLHPTKPYFCFAPCVDGEFRIDREHPFHGRYRYLITDAEPDADWLDAQWREWSGE